MHLFDILCRVNARILGCHIWVAFWGSTLEVLGPRNVDLLIKAAFIGQRFWGPKNGPLCKLHGAHFRTQKRDAKSCRKFRILLARFRGEFNRYCFFFGPKVSRITCLPARYCAALLAPWLSRSCRLVLERALIVKSDLLLFKAPIFTPQNSSVPGTLV